MRPEDILNLINMKVEEIKASLPDKGRRLELKCIILTEEQWSVLFNTYHKDEVESDTEGNKYTFTEEDMAQEYQPEIIMENFNIGGIPVRKGKEFDIEYIQKEKQRKYFRLKRSRRHEHEKEMES